MGQRPDVSKTQKYYNKNVDEYQIPRPILRDQRNLVLDLAGGGILDQHKSGKT
jgi:hypothetical protein